jgi:hypothetical protein
LGDAVYVGRPSLWGNRYTIGTWSNTLGREVETIEEAVRLYRDVVWAPSYMRAYIRERLAGKDLACWCRLCDAHRDGKPLGVDCPACAPCHADALLDLANSDLTKQEEAAE